MMLPITERKFNTFFNLISGLSGAVRSKDKQVKKINLNKMKNETMLFFYQAFWHSIVPFDEEFLEPEYNEESTKVIFKRLFSFNKPQPIFESENFYYELGRRIFQESFKQESNQ